MTAQTRKQRILPDMPADTPSADTPSAASPLIVIAVADPQLKENPELAAHKNELYAAGVRRHGGTPALLHSSVPLDERKRLLGAMAGLLLSGGADLEPALYGEMPQGAAGMDPVRDELELEAWREADRRSVPVLGICRGLQVIDRETILGRSLGGRAGASGAGTAGAADQGRLALTVNTFHHQAVREDLLATTLRPTAWADSEFGRLVEGFEGTGDRWLVAVQCHPERLDSTPADFERLWAAFVAAARDFAATPATETATKPAGVGGSAGRG